MKFAIVDLETTGGSPVHDRVVEIGIVLFEDGKEVGRYQSLVNPGIQIPFQVSMIHGISNEMIAGAPTFEELAEIVLKHTEDRIFVAHNVNFDYNFLKEEFKRIERKFERKKICSVRLAKKLLPELRSHSLRNLCAFYSIANERAHRALEDAVATTRILSRLLENENAISVIKQLLNGRAGINLLPPNLPDGRLQTLPEEPGV
jgi:DNA polymerase-3 subunit epsilon